MLLYTLLVLLPVYGLASACDTTAALALFDGIDASKDGNVDRGEADAVFIAFDVNGDKHVTIEEVVARVPDLMPAVKGHEAELFVSLDYDGDGLLTENDIVLDFKLTDTNKDGLKSRDEYLAFLQNVCGSQ